MGFKFSKKWKEYLCIFLIPTIALVNSLVQFYISSTSSLVKWKGGGFGMYSAIHYTDRNIWIEFNTESNKYYLNPFNYVDIAPYLIYPNREALFKLTKEVLELDLRVQGNAITMQKNAPKIEPIKKINVYALDTSIILKDKKYHQEIITQEGFDIEQFHSHKN